MYEELVNVWKLFEKLSRLSENNPGCLETLWLSGNNPGCLESFQAVCKLSRLSRNFLGCLETLQVAWNLSKLSVNFPGCLETFHVDWKHSSIFINAQVHLYYCPGSPKLGELKTPWLQLFCWHLFKGCKWDFLEIPCEAGANMGQRNLIWSGALTYWDGWRLEIEKDFSFFEFEEQLLNVYFRKWNKPGVNNIPI